MFYFKELFFRFQYFLISLFFSMFSCYLYKNILVPIICSSLIKIYSTFDGPFDKFIYNHPTELIKIQVLTSMVFTLIFSIPYVVWLMLDFFKSSLIKKEYNTLKIIVFSLLVLFCFLNLLSFFILFPYIWLFFQSLNNYENSNISHLNFFFELRIQDYFFFFLDFFYFFNLFLLIFLFLFLFVYFFGIISLISWKKLFIFFNIMFATFLSPPDVYSQILLFFVLTLISEFIILLYLYLFKLKKYF